MIVDNLLAFGTGCLNDIEWLGAIRLALIYRVVHMQREYSGTLIKKGKWIGLMLSSCNTFAHFLTGGV